MCSCLDYLPCPGCLFRADISDLVFALCSPRFEPTRNPFFTPVPLVILVFRPVLSKNCGLNTYQLAVGSVDLKSNVHITVANGTWFRAERLCLLGSIYTRRCFNCATHALQTLGRPAIATGPNKKRNTFHRLSSTGHLPLCCHKLNCRQLLSITK